jgi:outer membrane protein OmpA-like peptidoglycan-associated protein
VLAVAVSGCAGRRVRLDDQLRAFEDAARRVSRDLVVEFENRNSSRIPGVDKVMSLTARLSEDRDPNTFVIDPFVDGDSGNIVSASNAISRIVTQELVNSRHSYHVLPLSFSNIEASRYVVTGTIRYEAYLGTDTKRYRLYGSIVDVTNGVVQGSASSWVADRRIDDAPTNFYKNSPMYLKDRSVDYQIDAAVDPSTVSGTKAYVDTLNASAITSEGANALDRGDYRGAAKLFDASLNTSNGHTMKNFSGLYQAYYSLGDTAAAERAFYQLFALGVEDNNVKIKFLFAVNKTDFIGNQSARDQYGLWLHEIAQYLDSSHVCMDITGHASHTFTADYNRKLSLARAQRIEGILLQQAPNLASRLSARGVGFDENIIGSGTDDDQDAVDRRVEFRPISCGFATLLQDSDGPLSENVD